MSNLIYPQTYILSKCLESLIKTGRSRETQVKPLLSLSGVGQKQIQNSVKIIRMGGDYRPGTLISKLAMPNLTGYSLSKSFINIENYKLSALTPEVRLYRVSDNRKSFVPFYFPVSADFAFDSGGKLQLGEKAFTGGAATIENFSINLIGNNPYDAGRSMLTADLTVKVDSLSFIFEAPPGHTPLVDLFLIRTINGSTSPIDQAKSQKAGALSSGRNVNLMASIGYALPTNNNVFDENDIEAIRATNMLVNLYYSKHSISLEQNGSATISISYTGFLESTNGDSIWNILQARESKYEITKMKSTGDSAEIQPLSAPSKNKKKPKKKKPKKKPIDPIDLSASIRPIFENLFEHEKIYAVEFNVKDNFFIKEDEEDQEEETSTPTSPQPQSEMQVPFADTPVDNNDALKTLERIEPSAKNAPSGGSALFLKKYVHYINFGDFVDAYLSIVSTTINETKQKALSDKEKAATGEKANFQAMVDKCQGDILFLRDMLVCMGDVVFRRTKDDKEYRLNISDIPISIDTIYSLMYEDFVKLNKAFVGLKEMLVKKCLDLLRSSFNQFSSAELIHPVDFMVTNVSGQDLSEKMDKNGIVNVSFIPTSSKSFSKNNKNYYVFHQMQNAASSPMGRGDAVQDEADGIFHLNLNLDRGLVKGIQFNSMEVEGRQEYAMQGHGNAFDELRIPQNATVTMYGNNLFYPSMPLYINPDSIGFGDPRGKNSAARRLGYGGYYSVLTVSTTFQSGQLTTVLNTVWTSYPETNTQPKMSPGQKSAIAKQKKITETSRRK